MARNKQLVDILRMQDSSDDEYRRLQVRKNSQQTLLYLSQQLARKNQRFYTLEGDDRRDGSPDAPNPDIRSSGVSGAGFAAAKYSTYEQEPLLAAGESSHSEVYGSHQFMGSGHIDGWRSGYANITPFLSTVRYVPTAGSAGPSTSADNAISRLTGDKKALEKFFSFEITSAQMATLVPKIRLWKRQYTLYPSGSPQQGQVDHTVPPVDREIIFETALMEDQVLDFQVLGGNLGGNGIESFRWALKGVNPAEVDSNIEATLNVYFNNVNKFQQILDKINNPSSIVGAVTDATFMDLITFAPPTTKDIADLPCLENYTSEFFEIRILVGWETSDDNSLFTAAQLEHIKEQEVELFLTLTDHKFDFQEDGSASLEVNYRARSTMNDRDYDILKPRPWMQPAISSLETAREQRDEAVSVANEADVEADTSIMDKIVEEREEEVLKNQRALYRHIVGEVMQNHYIAYVPNILLLNGFNADETATRDTPGSPGSADEFTDERGLLTYSQLFKLLATPEKTKDTALTLQAPIRTALQQSLTNPIGVRRVTKDALSMMTATGLAAAGDMDFAEADELGFLEGEPITETPYGKSEIRFVYLGDIIEILLESCDKAVERIEKKEFAVMLSDVKFINYLSVVEKLITQYDTTSQQYSFSFYGMDFSKLRCSKTGLSPSAKKDLFNTINLANVPISLELFLDFFINTVIKPQKTTLYLDAFLGSLFHRLVLRALADPGVFGASSDKPIFVSLSVDTSKRSSVFSLPNRGNSEQPGKSTYKRSKYMADRAIIRSHVRQKREFNFINPVEEYVSPVTPTSRSTINPFKVRSSGAGDVATVRILGVQVNTDAYNGDYEENLRSSINNFLVGLDTGLIKSVQFERVDQPYLREARTATSKSFGVGQLRELYHVRLTLYGNNLLKPGQLIYVEPNSVIFGKPTDKSSAARVLGLGGYHLVVDVENEISADGWETKVKALHVSMPAVKNPSHI